MNPLALKVIPPVQVLLLGLVIWLAHRYFPVFHYHTGHELMISRALLLVGLVVFCMAVYQFWRHKTTVNPVRIDKTSALITTGVYAWSRNPIYLVDVIILIAWVVWLGAWLNLIVPMVFVWYITEFQIKPEEKMLSEKFGDSYARYAGQVRRWI